MNTNEKYSLTTVIDEIKNDRILLPDFQRNFVWKQEEKQISLISSVLAKMPIGSILLLEGKANEFALRKIGMRGTYQKTNDTDASISFLLDGQQRVTVLANAFSDTVAQNDVNFQKNQDIEIISSLRKRFFLSFPKYQELSDLAVYFGAKKLQFPYESNTYEDYPMFIAEDIKEQIVVYTYSRTGQNANSPFSPFYESDVKSLDLRTWCIHKNTNGSYLIPLYNVCEDTPNQSVLSQIIQDIGVEYGKTICTLYDNKSGEEKEEYAKAFFLETTYKEFQYEISQGKDPSEAFKEKIYYMANQWANNLKAYLVSCITNIYHIMSIITVKESERARAIDIYENLNLGGVSLSDFDLITARASLHPDNREFVKNITDKITKRLNDDDEDYEYTYAKTRIFKDAPYLNKTYMNSCGCLKNEDEFNSKFIDVFLNVLSLYSYSLAITNNDGCIPFGSDFIKTNEIKIEHTKRNAKLKLKPEQIHDNYTKACVGIDRALFFLKHRCGIRSINDVPYNHILSILSFIFINDSNYKDIKVHDILEAWYWTVIFSGEFDTDQNTRFIDNLKDLIIRLPNYSSNDLCEWIRGKRNKVLNKEDFSDEKMLVMAEAKPQPPKSSIQNGILQYYLSKYYSNFSMKDKNSPYTVGINSYTNDVYDAKEDNKNRKYRLEIHHIIPLNTMIDYTNPKLRTKSDFYGNSPLNKIFIVGEDNGEISDVDVSLYIKGIDPDTRRKLDLFISDDDTDSHEISNALSCTDEIAKRSKDNIIALYKLRFKALRNSVTSEIEDLLKLPAPNN